MLKTDTVNCIYHGWWLLNVTFGGVTYGRHYSCKNIYASIKCHGKNKFYVANTFTVDKKQT